MCKQYVPGLSSERGMHGMEGLGDKAAFQWDYAILVPQVRHTARNGKGLGTDNHQDIHTRYQAI